MLEIKLLEKMICSISHLRWESGKETDNYMWFRDGDGSPSDCYG